MLPQEEQIENKITEALKAREQPHLRAYRLIKATIKNERIKVGKDFAEADLFRVLRSELKKCHEAAEAFQRGGKAEVAKQELLEADIIKGLLPTGLAEEKIVEIIKEVITKQQAGSEINFGLVMKLVMAEVAGQADGSLVSRLVREQLTK